ncbi:50S ribosomal protein L28 [Sesbania bispinosa]|nr:50S ribosomal protein L28 [Sesbania bispinosa]
MRWRHPYSKSEEEWEPNLAKASVHNSDFYQPNGRSPPKIYLAKRDINEDGKHEGGEKLSLYEE